MRACLVVIALVAACGSAKKDDPKALSNAAKNAFEVPKVGVATVLAADDGSKVPLLVLIDDAGGMQLSWTAKWQDLSTKDLKAGAKTVDLDFLEKFIKEVNALGQDPAWALKNMDAYSDLNEPLPGAQDDPPPPEEEDKPDDGQDESGGTGTAMALEEGKMGKKDSDRAEGQYKMRKDTVPQQRDEAALARRKIMGTRGPTSFTMFANKPDELGNPSRLAEILGEVMTDNKLQRLPAVILASPRVKASKLIQAVSYVQAPIAVSHAGTVRLLRLDFTRDRDYANWEVPPHWLEARLSMNGIAIEAVPEAVIDVAWASGPLDSATLVAALDKARKTRALDPLAPVDVLVDADVDAQRLVDLLVALDVGGVRMIGLGNAPNAEQLKRRGHRNPTVAVGQPNAQGDLDKAVIRKVVRADALQKIDACYDAALAKQSDLSGTVMVQFFIAPTGKVKTADAAGVDPDLAKCVAGVINKLEFPKPKGGGGVQVNYPFTMRP